MASVSIRNVIKRFGDTAVLHGVSIDIPDGSFTGVIVSFQQIDTVAAGQAVASPMRRLGM